MSKKQVNNKKQDTKFFNTKLDKKKIEKINKHLSDDIKLNEKNKINIKNKIFLINKY
jgi:hypothetical protein